VSYLVIDTDGRGVRVLILRGAGTRAFRAGADLEELLAREPIDDRRRHFDGVARVIPAVTEDGQDGIQAFFDERRPVWTGR